MSCGYNPETEDPIRRSIKAATVFNAIMPNPYEAPGCQGHKSPLTKNPFALVAASASEVTALCLVSKLRCWAKRPAPNTAGANGEIFL